MTSVSFPISFPIVQFIFLFIPCASHAGLSHRYPFRLHEKVGVIRLLHGPTRPSLTRSSPRRCPAQMPCRAAAPVSNESRSSFQEKLNSAGKLSKTWGVAQSERFPTFLHLWIRSNRALSSKATGISIIQLPQVLLHKAAACNRRHERQLRADRVEFGRTFDPQRRRVGAENQWHPVCSANGPTVE